MTCWSRTVSKQEYEDLNPNFKISVLFLMLPWTVLHCFYIGIHIPWRKHGQFWFCLCHTVTLPVLTTSSIMGGRGQQCVYVYLDTDTHTMTQMCTCTCTPLRSSLRETIILDLSQLYPQNFNLWRWLKEDMERSMPLRRGGMPCHAGTHGEAPDFSQKAERSEGEDLGQTLYWGFHGKG